MWVTPSVSVYTIIDVLLITLFDGQYPKSVGAEIKWKNHSNRTLQIDRNNPGTRFRMEWPKTFPINELIMR
jgi:hypothetical protein